MRHALSRTIANLAIIGFLASTATAFDDSVAASISDARKQIESGQYASAVNVLDEALISAPKAAKPLILDLLRQAYSALAKEADEAGRPRDAAHYRDNLAILATAKPESPAQPQRPASPAATPTPKQDAKPAATTLPPMSAITALPSPAPLAEPSALPPPSLLENSDSPKNRTIVAPAPQPAKPKITPPVSVMPKPAKLAPDKPAAAKTNSALAKQVTRPTEEAEQPTPSPKPEPLTTAEADRLFVARQYEQAGARYAALAAQQALPADRNPHWAYCRKVAVVQTINAHPRTAREWDAIEQEIREIQQLMPNNWFGEYLKNYVAEARRTTPRLPSAPGEGVVVRGSAPEETPTRPSRLSKFLKRAKGDPALDQTTASPTTKPATPIKPRLSEQPLELPAEGSSMSGSIQAPPAPQEPATSPQNDPVSNPAPSPADNSPQHSESLSAASTPPTTQPVLGIDAPLADLSPPKADPQVIQASAGERSTASPRPFTAEKEPRWQLYETRNFRIYHSNLELAQKAGEVAEQVRARQAERWSSPAARATWTPRCDFYLYTDGNHLARKTGQTETSPGFSTMGTSGNKVTTRLIHLRADHPDLLAAVLPHEVTHVVMADLFVSQQIPRWADEGIAVMAEPADTQRLRAADLKQPLETGSLIALDHLMTMDYPAPQHLDLYYAQSISLTRFLVAQGPPDQFLKFVRHSQRAGIEPALREVYQIEGLAALQDRWLAYAREQVLPRTASASAAGVLSASDRVSR